MTTIKGNFYYLERIARIASIVLIAFLAVFCSKPKSYENPVIRGDVADPSLIRIGDTYYAAGTSSEWAPFYPMFMSKDLVNWTQTGHVFEQQPEWTVSSFWAPELFYHNDKVYCYYTARRKADGISCIGVAVADSPTGKFTDHGVIVDHGNEAIDAFVYDDNGQLYITWKAYGLDARNIEIVGSKLSADGLRLEGDPFTMLVDDENIGMEGQYHFKEGGYYYIVYAERGCCGPGSDYQVAVARSMSFEGPYEKYEGNPILVGGDDFLSCGHGTATTTPDGRYFFMCHAYMKDEKFYQGRQPILQEMKLDDSGWVYFPTGKKARIEQPVPFSGTKQKEIPDFKDDFTTQQLRHEWIWNYTHTDMQYEVKNGNLYLSGTPKENNNYGTVLCLRPVSADYVYETQVAEKNSSVKGLTIYGDARGLIFLAYVDDKVVLRSVKDGVEEAIYETTYDKDQVHLRIEIENGRECRFSWSENGKVWTRINDTPFDGGSLIRWDRVARPGLIHIGESDVPAVFSSFSMKSNSDKK